MYMLEPLQYILTAKGEDLIMILSSESPSRYCITMAHTLLERKLVLIATTKGEDNQFNASDSR